MELPYRISPTRVRLIPYERRSMGRREKYSFEVSLCEKARVEKAMMDLLIFKKEYFCHTTDEILTVLIECNEFERDKLTNLFGELERQD